MVQWESKTSKTRKIPTIEQRNVPRNGKIHMQIATRSKTFSFLAQYCVNGHKLFDCEFLDPPNCRVVHLLHGSMISNYLSLAHISPFTDNFLESHLNSKAIVTEAFNVGP